MLFIALLNKKDIPAKNNVFEMDIFAIKLFNSKDTVKYRQKYSSRYKNKNNNIWYESISEFYEFIKKS